MIELTEKQQIIIKAYFEGNSFRKIAKTVGLHRDTVSKYVREYEEKRQKLIAEGKIKGGSDVLELIDDLVEKPKYNSKNRSKRKLSGEIIEKIKYYLEENEQKKLKGQAKQQKKKIDIYEALVDEGYDISYPTVCNTIRELKKETSEAYIKADYLPGEVCEFDWGEVKLYIDNRPKTFQMSAFASAKGNYRDARLFTKQDTASFLEAHASFFEHIGGVYKTLVYDNMKVAVKKFVGLNEKEPTESLLKLSLYYGFNFRFCNVCKGNEKGHIERSVEYIRRKAFAKRDHFNSLEEANEYLQQICYELNNKPQKLNNNQTALEILNLEKEYLLPKMPMYDAARTTELRVDKYSTVTIDSCHYSVPDLYVGKILFVKIYSNKIRCFFDGEKIAEHDRKYGHFEWSIKLEHYLKTLKKKPGALASSLALHQANSRVQKIYLQYYNKKEKEFIELLHFIFEKSNLKNVEEAIETLVKLNPFDITTEKIKAICNRNEERRLTNFNNKPMETEIAKKSNEMLEELNKLIPISSEDFNKEVAIA